MQEIEDQIEVESPALLENKIKAGLRKRVHRKRADEQDKRMKEKQKEDTELMDKKQAMIEKTKQ